MPNHPPARPIHPFAAGDRALEGHEVERLVGFTIVQTTCGGKPAHCVALPTPAQSISDVVMRSARLGIGVRGLALPTAAGIERGCLVVAFRGSGRPVGVLSSPPRAVAAVLEVVRALEPLHGQGVAHGMIRAEFVLSTDTGIALTGFGIATALLEIGGPAAVRDATAPAYLAPEQRTATPARPETWTDTYQLAVLIVELLLGWVPAEVTAEALPDILGGTVSDAFSEELGRALASSPAGRPLDLRAWLRRLESAALEAPSQRRGAAAAGPPSAARPLDSTLTLGTAPSAASRFGAGPTSDRELPSKPPAVSPGLGVGPSVAGRAAASPPPGGGSAPHTSATEAPLIASPAPSPPEPSPPEPSPPEPSPPEPSPPEPSPPEPSPPEPSPPEPTPPGQPGETNVSPSSPPATGQASASVTGAAPPPPPPPPPSPSDSAEPQRTAPTPPADVEDPAAPPLPPAPDPPAPAVEEPGRPWLPVAAIGCGALLLCGGGGGLFAFAMVRNPPPAPPPPTVATTVVPPALPPPGVPAPLPPPSVATPAPPPSKVGTVRVTSPAPSGRDATALMPVNATTPVWGGESALTTIVLFGDLECPHTRRQLAVLAELKRDLKDDLRLAWRHRPQPTHKHAEAAAAVGVGILDKEGNRGFWSYVAAAADDDKPVTKARIDAWARVASSGDTRAWEKDKAIAARIAGDLALAGKYDVRATPTMFLNGRMLEGFHSVAVLEQPVKEEIAKARALRGAGTPQASLYSARVRKNLINVGPDAKARTCPSIADAPVRGASDALVTIVEFSDFECPFCAKVQPALKRVLSTYPRDVRLVWRDLPLSFHRRARPAANLALEAYKVRSHIGFWDVHDRLFSAPNLEDSTLADIASKAGLPATAMTNVRARAHSGRIDDDAKAAAAVGARGTPTFFINGVRLAGAQPYSKFDEQIRKELAGAKKLVESGTPRAKVYRALCGG